MFFILDAVFLALLIHNAAVMLLRRCVAKMLVLLTRYTFQRNTKSIMKGKVGLYRISCVS